jgi:hypothetical protein
MKIGGSNEITMIVGPILAIVLIVGFTMGGDPGDMVRVVERFAQDGWSVVVTAFRR